jgi:hypothetical protein
MDTQDIWEPIQLSSSWWWAILSYFQIMFLFLSFWLHLGMTTLSLWSLIRDIGYLLCGWSDWVHGFWGHRHHYIRTLVFCNCFRKYNLQGPRAFSVENWHYSDSEWNENGAQPHMGSTLVAKEIRRQAEPRAKETNHHLSHTFDCVFPPNISLFHFNTITLVQHIIEIATKIIKNK